MALTMDVFAPQQNGKKKAVLWIVSGAWFSSHESISLKISLSQINALVQHGYTVFAIVHSSQPKFTIPEILPDIHRAVRYIRYHAADYQIDPNRIGITGASSGGHLALMQALAGDLGSSVSSDPIEHVSSRVQAVACFFPPTDFLNYGKPGKSALGRGLLRNFPAPFAFQEPIPERPASGMFAPVTNNSKIRKIGRQISPINYVTADDPPTLVIHGDKDILVPIQQSKILIAKLEQLNIPCQLITKPGAGHGWTSLSQDMYKIAAWFDQYL